MPHSSAYPASYDNTPAGGASMSEMTAEMYVSGHGPPNMASKESAEMKNVTTG
jgi:hypothetical protein